LAYNLLYISMMSLWAGYASELFPPRCGVFYASSLDAFFLP
jgi:hypothetical protein